MPAQSAPRRADLVREAARALASAGVAEPRACAELLWCRAAAESRTDFALRAAEAVDVRLAEHFTGWIRRFAQGEPLAYLEGSCGFYGLDFAVDRRVLVPRADSEAVVECALALLPLGAQGMIADLGTGSGCLLLTLLHERSGLLGLGVDRSAEALAVAHGNARRLGLARRAGFVRGDWWEPVRGPCLLAVANPPYVVPGEALGPGVAEFEPHGALFTPVNDPLHAYRRILARGGEALASAGTLVCEVGAERADEVSALAATAGWQEIARHRDLGGIERALAFRFC
jgi:release factor glutamine methyltransferase